MLYTTSNYYSKTVIALHDIQNITQAKKAYENMDEKCPKDEHGGRDRESRTY